MTIKAQNRETGNEGERLAAEYLAAKGYEILHKNWKGDRCEIDIISHHRKTIVFVEVKMRTGAGYGWPEQAVNKAKQQHIVKAANAFIEMNKIENEIRFDIVSIIKAGKEYEIYHIEDAFVP